MKWKEWYKDWQKQIYDNVMSRGKCGTKSFRDKILLKAPHDEGEVYRTRLKPTLRSPAVVDLIDQSAELLTETGREKTSTLGSLSS
jgi:hypothetical protein